ncbi:SH3 domain-containing protein, partial [mine drainage metagenome]
MTAKVRMLVPHEPPDRPPLRIRPGERLKVGELDETWPTFRWCVSAEGIGGWVPEACLVDAADASATAVRSYDTTELRTGAGDILAAL